MLLLVNKGQLKIVSKRDDLLLAYWSIVVEHNRGLSTSPSGKFTLWRFA